MDPQLDALRRLVERACRDMATSTTSKVLDEARCELDVHFAALTERIANDEAVPLEAVGELDVRLRDAEMALPDRARWMKYSPDVPRTHRWTEIVHAFSSRLFTLRYDVFSARKTHACDCLVLVELGSNHRRPASPRLRSIGYDHDGYYNGDAYACDECGTRWWHGTEDTESQHVEWWEPRAASWAPATPPA